MQFLNTIWLWGLAGLVVPIGIHLLNRKTGKVIRFGNIRHLSDTETRQFKRLRLNELILLGLRCLIIALLVFFLSKLHFSTPEKKGRWLLVDNDLAGDPHFAVLTDSLTRQGFEIRALITDFPLLHDTTSGEENVDYWGLLEKLKAQSLEQVVIVANSYLKGFRGKRKNLPAHIQWLSKDPDSKEYVLNAVKGPGDSITLRFGKSTPLKTSFYSRKVRTAEVSQSSTLNSVTIEPADTLSVAVVYDPAYVYDKNIMMAAIKAVGKGSPVIPEVESIPLNKYFSNTKWDWLVWLSDKKSTGISQNIITIDVKEPPDAHLFVPTSTSDSTVTWRLTQRLNEEVALKDNLAVELALTMTPTTKYDERMDALDRRILPEEMRWSKNSIDDKNLQAVINTKSSERIIVIGLVLALLAERLLAFKRNQ